MGKTNRTETIRKEMFHLFIIIFLFSGLSSAAGLSYFIIFNGKNMLIVIPLILMAFAAWVFIFIRLVKILKPLEEYTLLDSSEINRIIAKNTAPLRKKYYILYNIQKEKDKKIILLRYNLERLYIKINQDRKKSNSGAAE